MHCGPWNAVQPPAAYGLLQALVTLALTGPLPAQIPSDSLAQPPAQLASAVAAIAPASFVRVATRTGTFTGRVGGRSSDSLTIVERASARHRRIAVMQIDTLWVSGPQRNTGVLVGILLGGLVAGALFTGGSEPDDTGVVRILAALALAGGILIGSVVDAGAESWTQSYPPL